MDKFCTEISNSRNNSEQSLVSKKFLNKQFPNKEKWITTENFESSYHLKIK